MEYESDPAKALINQRKHGVAFDDAATCVLDPMDTPFQASKAPLGIRM